MFLVKMARVCCVCVYHAMAGGGGLRTCAQRGGGNLAMTVTCAALLDSK